MSWIYEIRSGRLTNPDGKFVAIGYSGGDEGRRPDGVNNPAMTSVKSVGPLPRGKYTMGVPVEHSHLGPFAIPLTPDASNVMYGRGDFFVHGDTTPGGNASEGCVIMSRPIRNAMWASLDHELEVKE